MRTNIVLNDQLVKEAFSYVPVKTKRELIETALRELVQNHRRLNLLDLAGQLKIRDDYDYKNMRSRDAGQ
ncbi:MAG: type II toxin-antitoxin system VapB family antitoxin [Deltaproteobacteria bacterium]|nr:type II toxin-antitoxin system VapB family antitoxin [Deltaproteobacteria bacterium]